MEGHSRSETKQGRMQRVYKWQIAYLATARKLTVKRFIAVGGHFFKSQMSFRNRKNEVLMIESKLSLSLTQTFALLTSYPDMTSITNQMTQ